MHATSFIGREAELAEISSLLSSPNCRLLTLTGPGGIGKTRLAMEAASQANFQHGAHFVPLQPLSSSDAIVPTIVTALKLSFSADRDTKTQLLGYLREKQLLLVLDNFEHLLDGADLLPEILEAAPDVRMVATSRERLRLLEEWVVDVDGLPFPKSVQVSVSLDSYNATQLFVQSARRVGYTPRTADSASIISICQLVEGIPLAIELSAAWTRIIPCGEIANEIQRSLDILSTNLRNVPERHRSMRAVFEHSWRLLSVDEQQVFQQLSVFRGGFTREAAETVTGASLQILSSLADKSLLRVVANDRYDIHELLRQYADEQLRRDNNQWLQTRTQYCTYYANFMDRWNDDLATMTNPEITAMLIREIENVRAALRQTMEEHRIAEMSKFLQPLGLLYDSQGWYREGFELFHEAAECLQNVRDEKDEQQQRLLGLCLAYQAFNLMNLSRTDEARMLAHESLSILLPFESGREIVYTYFFLGFLAINPTDGKQYVQKARIRAQASDFHWGIMMGCLNYGLMANRLGEYEESRKSYTEGLSLSRKRNFRYGETRALQGLSEGAIAQLHWTEAKKWAEEARTAAQAIGLRQALAESSLVLANVAYAHQNYEAVLLYCQESLIYARETGYLGCTMTARNGIARTMVRMSDHTHAREYFRATMNIALKSAEKWHLWDTLEGFAELMMAEKHFEYALAIVACLFHNSDHRSNWRPQNYIEHLGHTLELSLPPEAYTLAWEYGSNLELIALGEAILSGQEPSPLAAQTGSHTTLTDSAVNPLSHRETEILQLVAVGYSNQEIADRLFIGISTVKKHINHIYEKLDVESRTQAVARAREQQLLH